MAGNRDRSHLMSLILDPSQRAAIDLMERGKNVFLTGDAGTGKSTVITTFLGAALNCDPDVTATTGVAALNLRDQFEARSGLLLPVSTIYRWAGIMLGPRLGESNEDCLSRLRREMVSAPRIARSRARAWYRVEHAECLVIDEISMLPGRVFSFLEFLCRSLRNDDAPWGGLQIIAVGDFLQLPPVAKDGLYDWAFQTPAWEATQFVPAVLRHIHRQADPVFLGLLNAVRRGHVNGTHSHLLSSRVALFPPSSLLRLFTHNIQVDKWNLMRLGVIDSPVHQFIMTDTGHPECEWIRKSLLTPEILDLKVGARVMVTANLSKPPPGGGRSELYAVNGAIGTVTDIHTPTNLPSPYDSIELDLDDGTHIDVFRYTWLVDPAHEERGGVTQFPLRLAWAATIHKVQGLSLDAALIDARATREPGQTYVALSRVRTLPGLWLRDIFTGLWISNEAIEFMDKLSPGS
jgi:nucleoside-triphosphatase THEP1